MLELLIANVTYVAYRLFVSATIVRLLTLRMSYYLAVLVMAQISFAYDNIIFYYYYGATQMPEFVDLLLTDITYTLRVIAAWFIIKKLWDWLDSWLLAVFIGAQLTFAVDCFIFDGIY